MNVDNQNREWVVVCCRDSACPVGPCHVPGASTRTGTRHCPYSTPHRRFWLWNFIIGPRGSKGWANQSTARTSKGRPVWVLWLEKQPGRVNWFSAIAR